MELKIEIPGSTHAYNVEIEPKDGYTKAHVHARNRDQAARAVTKRGFEVRSVNMVG